MTSISSRPIQIKVTQNYLFKSHFLIRQNFQKNDLLNRKL